MNLPPHFPRLEYDLEVAHGQKTRWRLRKGRADNFKPYAILANVGPSTEVLREAFLHESPKALRYLAMKLVRQTIPDDVNQGLVYLWAPSPTSISDYGGLSARQRWRDIVGARPNKYHRVNKYTLDESPELTNASPGPMPLADDFDFHAALKSKWEHFEGVETKWSKGLVEAWEWNVLSLLAWELHYLIPFFINKMEQRSPVEKLASLCFCCHRGVSNEVYEAVAVMITHAVVGKDFHDACDFWASRSPGACLERELGYLKGRSGRVEALVRECLEDPWRYRDAEST